MVSSSFGFYPGFFVEVLVHSPPPGLENGSSLENEESSKSPGIISHTRASVSRMRNQDISSKTILAAVAIAACSCTRSTGLCCSTRSPSASLAGWCPEPSCSTSAGPSLWTTLSCRCSGCPLPPSNVPLEGHSGSPTAWGTAYASIHCHPFHSVRTNPG